MYFLGLIGIIWGIISFQPKSVDKVTHNRDTLVINNTAYFLDSIPESVYQSLPDPAENTSIDTSRIKIFSNSILIVTPEKTLVLKNDTSISELFKKYHYESTFSSIGYVHIHVDGWESSSDLLISLKNGEKLILWGKPKLSPDNSMIICGSVDFGAGYLPTGMQLFKVEDGHINKIFEVNIENWGPKEIKWESDTSILVKRLKVDFADGYKEYYDYRRMKIN